MEVSMEVLPPDISQGSHISVWEVESDFCFKEPLKNSPIHRLSVYGVSRGEKASATTNSGGADWVREVRAEDEAGAVSRGDGAGGAVGRVTGSGRTALSEGRERAASGGTEHHVAGVLSAAVVQSERSGGGGCAV